MNDYLVQLQTKFRNMALNAVGVERDLLTLLKDKDIDKALSLFENRSDVVDEAIAEYNPETHEVMSRRDKPRKGQEPYITEKLPRTRQVYINEVELFFLLGSDLLYHKKDGEDEAFNKFSEFIKENHINSLHRQFKRLAGAETQAAIVYHLYNDNGEIRCKPFVAARSTGYDIRPLFDQYGNMLAFAYGTRLKRNGKTIETWTIETPELIFECEKSKVGWNVIARENIAKKILAIYGKQPKAWAGAEKRLSREEMIDSKQGDNNNYFSDPIAYASADVISLLGEDTIGRLLQYSSKDSVFGYVTPPNGSQPQQLERENLQKSILFDTFTPDLSYESIKGLGSLSGEAIENSLILGFIKRANRMEIYGELFAREVNVIIAILSIMYPTINFKNLKIEIEFQSPFANQKTSKWALIGQIYSQGIISLDTAVNALALTDAPEEEIAKIRAMQAVEQNNK